MTPARLLALLFLTGALAQAAPREPLQVALSAPGSRAELHTTARNLEKAMTRLLGRPVKATPHLDSKAAVEALVRGEAQLAWLPPWAWLEAAERANAVPLVRSVRRGARHYRSVVYVRQDSPIVNPSDLAGRRLAWAGLDSTSGYVVPRRLLYSAEVVPASEEVLGRHARVCQAVWRREVDAGATFSTADDGRVDGCLRALGADASKLRVVITSGPIPNDGIVASPALPVEVREMVRQRLLGLTADARAGVLLDVLAVDRFEPPSPDELDMIRRLVQPEAPAR